MQISSDSTPTRTRQACDPCRRKKTKCPGEKPTCSTCERLKQQCNYGGMVDNAYRVQKHTSVVADPRNSEERFRRLESRLEDIFDILGQNAQPSTGSGSPNVNTRTAHTQASDVLESRGSHFDVAKWRNDNITAQLDDLVSVYTNKIDHQPLPLFHVAELSALLQQWPDNTLLSFLAVTSLFSSHVPYENANEDMAELLHRAKQEIFMDVGRGNADLHILQALCLIALGEISLGNHSVVSLITSIAGRLITGRAMGTVQERREYHMSKDLSRCCWSIFLLDQMYHSHSAIPSVLPAIEFLPNRPPSASTPFESDGQGNEWQGSQLQRPQDHGIDSYCMTLFSIWGKTLDLVQKIRRNESQDHWPANSAYHSIVSDLYDFETSLAQVHRAQRARFQERTGDELTASRAYWLPWITMQFLFHTVQETINHPFFHVANRKQHSKFRPPTFLQTTIDQALSHASWIVKLIDMIRDNDFGWNDPFLAHLVAITATTYLFLFNSKDADLANQARTNFEKCCLCLEDLAITWPQLTHAIDKLKQLQNGADLQTNNTSRATRALAQESVLWDVFSYTNLTSPSTYSDNSSDTVELGVTTQFISPASDVQSGRPLQRMNEAGNNSARALRSLGMESALNTNSPYEIFNIFDTSEMADFSTLNIGRDLFTDFGQL